MLEEDDELHTSETVDYSDFDLVKKFQEHSLSTLCLDECHHLRSEWWKALEQFKSAFPQIFTVALTATPPYDLSLIHISLSSLFLPPFCRRSQR